VPKIRANGRVGARWRADNLTPTSGISWETIPSENKWVIWLDTYVQGWNGCATSKSPKPLPNEIQSVASSSTWRQMVIQRTKKFTTKELEKSASDKRTAVKATSELQSAKRALKRTLPSAHKAWLLRTRTHGGVCSSEPMWCLGAPSILKHATLAEDNVWRQCLKTMFEDLYALSCTTLCWKCVQYVKKEVNCICCMYKIFVCTKFYVQKNTCVYKNILLDISKIFSFMLGFL